MLTVNDQLLIELTKRVQLELDEHAKTLAAGHLPDHAAYKALTGEIRGLQRAVEIAEGALSDIMKR